MGVEQDGSGNGEDYKPSIEEQQKAFNLASPKELKMSENREVEMIEKEEELFLLGKAEEVFKSNPTKEDWEEIVVRWRPKIVHYYHGREEPDTIEGTINEIESSKRSNLINFLEKHAEDKETAAIALDIARSEQTQRRLTTVYTLGSIPGTPTHCFKIEKNYRKFKSRIFAGDKIKYQDDETIGRYKPDEGFSLMVAGKYGYSAFVREEGEKMGIVGGAWGLRVPFPHAVKGLDRYEPEQDRYFLILKSSFFFDKIDDGQTLTKNIKRAIKDPDYPPITESEIAEKVNESLQRNPKKHPDIDYLREIAKEIITFNKYRYEIYGHGDAPVFAIRKNEKNQKEPLPITAEDIQYFVEVEDFKLTEPNGIFCLRLIANDGHILTTQEWDDLSNQVESNNKKLFDIKQKRK